MAQQTSNLQDELEQLVWRFDEFRKTQPLRSRLLRNLCGRRPQ